MNRILIIILAAALFSVADVRAQASAITLGAPQTPGLPEGPAASAQAKDGVKGLSWFEISTFSPGLKPVDDALIARMEVTWKLKLRTFRRNAQFAAMLSFDPKLKADWKKIAAECTRIIKK